MRTLPRGERKAGLFVVILVSCLASGVCVRSLGAPRGRRGPAPRFFVPPQSGPLVGRYFGYNIGRAALHGTSKSASVVAFSAYSGRHQNAVLRWIARAECWGGAYHEVAEFVPTRTFLYNTGWYPGGADNMYHPGDFGGNLSRDFASIRVQQCSIQTPDGWFDITPMLDPALGEPYALTVVPPYSYRLHCEAELVQNDTGRVLFQFVHDQQWDPPRLTYNPLFHGKQTQPAIRQTESWRDSRGVALNNSGASYALGLGCFWQVFTNQNRLAGLMLYSWPL